MWGSILEDNPGWSFQRGWSPPASPGPWRLTRNWRRNTSLVSPALLTGAVLLSSEYLLALEAASVFRCGRHPAASPHFPLCRPWQQSGFVCGVMFCVRPLRFWVPGDVVSLSAFVHVIHGLDSGYICLVLGLVFFGSNYFIFFCENLGKSQNWAAATTTTIFTKFKIPANKCRKDDRTRSAIWHLQW